MERGRGKGNVAPYGSDVAIRYVLMCGGEEIPPKMEVTIVLIDEEEEWRNLAELGYPNYDVSNMGNIYGKKKRRILRPKPRWGGYVELNLYTDSGVRSEMAHVLVARMFIPNPEGKETVDHVNGVRDDNRAVNLRWATRSEQSANRKVPERGRGREIHQLTSAGGLVAVWPSIALAADTTGYGRWRIGDCCRGGKEYDGYRWKYVEDIEQPIPGEEWRSIPYEDMGDKLVSNMGRVKFANGKITKGNTPKKFSRHFSIGAAETGKNYLVHRLVAAAFFGRNDELVVNHRNGDPMDNRAENLEYCTYSENTQHAVRTGLIDTSKSKRYRPVLQMDDEGNVLAEFATVVEAAKAVNTVPDNILQVCDGTPGRYRTRRYRWKYKPT